MPSGPERALFLRLKPDATLSLGKACAEQEKPCFRNSTKAGQPDITKIINYSCLLSTVPVCPYQPAGNGWRPRVFSRLG